jgi:isopenicillin N synthase-like dioxygenase
LPDDTKRQYHVAGGGGARGYTPFGVETAKGAQHHDLKEFWHIGREIPRDHHCADVMPANLWPDEIPEFREVGYGLYQALDKLGAQVLAALALHIGLPENYFADKTNYGNSILRPIHYPPITTPDIPNVRAGAHEDINLITLLVGASAAGLEVKSRYGRVGAIHLGCGHDRRQHRRHAAAPDQSRVSRRRRIAWSIRRANSRASRAIRRRSSCTRIRIS